MEKTNFASCVFLLIIKNNKILLQKRKSTKLLSNTYDFAVSGHVEKNETAKSAIIREAKEEINIDLKEVEYVGTYNIRYKDIDYIDLVFICNNYEGEPEINEIDKISSLEWFDLDELPHDRGFHVDFLLSNYINKIQYDTFGYEKDEL